MHDRPLEVIMSTLRINRRFSLVGTLILSALTLGALALPLSPATAQCLGVDLGFGCAGLGVGSWYSHPYYYGYATYRGPIYYGYLAPAPAPVQARPRSRRLATRIATPIAIGVAALVPNTRNRRSEHRSVVFCRL